MNYLADAILRFRRVLYVLGTLATVVALAGMTRLKLDDHPRELFQRRNADTALLRQIHHHFGSDDNDVVLIVRGDHLFSRESLTALDTIVRQAEQVDGVEFVYSIFDIRRQGVPIPLIPPLDAPPERFAFAERLAAEHPMVAGHLVSEDGSTMLALVRLAGDSLPASHLARVLADLQKIVEPVAAQSGLQIGLAGSPPLRVDTFVTLQREQVKFTALGAALSLAIALAVFRSGRAVAIALAGPTLGVLWTLGLMGWLGERIDGVKVVLPSLLYIVGFTDSAHLLADIRRSRAASSSPRVAAANAVRHVGWACFLTSATTAAGFGSLVLADTESIRRFGFWCALGAGMLYLTVAVGIPLLSLTRLGDNLGAPRSATSPRANTWLVAFVMGWLRRPGWVVATSVMVCAALAVVSSRLKPDVRWSEAIPYTSSAAQATAQLDASFGGSAFAFVLVEWPQNVDLASTEVRAVLEEVHTILEEQPGLGRPFSILNMAASLQRGDSAWAANVRRLARVPEEATAPLLRRDLGMTLVRVFAPDVGAAALEPTFAAIEKRLEELQRRYPGFRLRLTGTPVVAARNLQRMIADLAQSILMAAVLVFGIMTAEFRSWRLGAISVLPNAFPLLLVAGTMAALGEPLRLTTALTFCMCLGIAVDDTIHFLARYQHERKTSAHVRQAIRRTLAAIGNVLVATTVILVGGLGLMAISDMPAIRHFALLSSTAIAAALAGDLIILPALLLCFPAKSRVRPPAPELDAVSS